jgi:uncharacterized membrane protein YedE/YeeE
MKANLASFVSGLLFAMGLGIAGMTQPQKVMGFLDFTGASAPSLMMVMVGGIGVNALAYHLVAKRRAKPFFSESWALPTRKELDAKLIVGAAIFGVGWGLGGFCPGPGLVSLASGAVEAIVFSLAILVGMVICAFASRANEAPRQDA